MILIVTNKDDEHADRVISRLHERRTSFLRFNTEDFPLGVKASSRYGSDPGFFLELPYHTLTEDVSAIWYRRPVDPIIDPKISDRTHREYARLQATAFLQWLWYSLCDRLWVNHPEANHRAEQTMLQLTIACQLGFIVPETLVTNDPTEAQKFLSSRPGTDFVLKQLRGTRLNLTGLSDAAIETHLLTEDDMRYINDISATPVILQEYVHKSLELRVTVIGPRVFTAALFSQQTREGRVDWRRSVQDDLRHERYDLPEDISERCRRLVKGLGLKFGAIDLILTPEGHFVFLEINPNGQWTWIESRTGMPMVDALIDLLSPAS